jgi:hypothetical protein
VEPRPVVVAERRVDLRQSPVPVGYEAPWMYGPRRPHCALQQLGGLDEPPLGQPDLADLAPVAAQHDASSSAWAIGSACSAQPPRRRGDPVRARRGSRSRASASSHRLPLRRCSSTASSRSAAASSQWPTRKSTKAWITAASASRDPSRRSRAACAPAWAAANALVWSGRSALRSPRTAAFASVSNARTGSPCPAPESLRCYSVPATADDAVLRVVYEVAMRLPVADRLARPRRPADVTPLRPSTPPLGCEPAGGGE